MKLIRYDRKNFFVQSTELGRISSNFYIKCETMDKICKEFKITFDQSDYNVQTTVKNDFISELRLFRVLANCKEFENIKVRDDETNELKFIEEKCWIFDESFNTN